MKNSTFLLIATTLIVTNCTHTPNISLQNAQASLNQPIIIGHRGSSGERPEHTLEAYERAIDQNADFIEPDLVMTKDLVLIARHENEISETTDVAEKFPNRKTKKLIDGQTVTGWFSEDFTLAEIKTLKAKERLPFRDQSFNGKFDVPTFEEVLQLIEKKNKQLNKRIGVYPETKHPTFFQSIQKPLEPELLRLLKKYGYEQNLDRVFIQSFETQNLKDMSQLTKMPMAQLIGSPFEKPYDFVVKKDPRGYEELTTDEGLREIAQYAKAVSPYKRYIVPTNIFDYLKEPTDFIQRAHRLGLLVHTWTLRAENRYLAKDYQGDIKKEVEHFMSLGIDGIFTDHPGRVK